MILDLTILYEQDEDGWWVAEIPEVSGVFSQGKTRAEAREMVMDALQLMLETRRDTATGRAAKIDKEILHLAA